MDVYIVITVIMACWLCQNKVTECSAITTLATASGETFDSQERVESSADYNQMYHMIQELQSQLSSLAHDNQQHKNKISALESKVEDLEKENKQLRNMLSHNNSTLEKRMVDESQHGMPFKHKAIQDVGNQEENLSNKIFSQVYEQCLSKWRAQEKHNIQFEDKIKQLEDFKTKIQSSFVSFTAYPSVQRNYNAGQVVLFDAIINNYGNFYNSTSSIFTCPYTGYYLFSTNIMASSTKRMGTYLNRDSQALVRTNAYDFDTYGHSSNSVVTLCESGQNVYVTAFYDGTSLYNAPFSTFSGTLLRIL